MAGEAPKRSDEARAYDQGDWPGSSSFHPPHIEKLFRDMGKEALEDPANAAWPSDAMPFTDGEGDQAG